MDWIEKNIEKYLEMEGILNRFFTRFNYCVPRCIHGPAHAGLPNPGCCRGRYHREFDLDHPAFERLRQERERRFGRPDDYRLIKRISPCEYHTLTGCRLETHKSPVCLGFLCRPAVDFLRERHGIFTYDYLGFHYAMEWILTGDLPDRDFEAFRAECRRMTAAL